MVHMLICLTTLLLQLNFIYCKQHENVTIYIGRNEPCTATVTFTYTEAGKNSYKMEILFTKAPAGGPFPGVAANVLPGYGPTETLIQYTSLDTCEFSPNRTVLTFKQVQVEPNATIVVPGEEITAVRGVFEPTSKKFIILKSTLNKKPNQLYSTLQTVKDALKKGGTDNISKAAYIIRLGGSFAEYYSVDVNRFQDSDFQKTPKQDEEEKTLILNFIKEVAKLDHDDAKQVHWIKINKNIIGGKINPDVYKLIQSIGEYIAKNKNSSIGITCIKQELETLIKACGKTKPKEIEIWGPLAYQSSPQTSFTWQKLQVTEKLNIRMGKMEANIESGGNASSITLEAIDT